VRSIANNPRIQATVLGRPNVEGNRRNVGMNLQSIATLLIVVVLAGKSGREV
jgi:hypothetical protein